MNLNFRDFSFMDPLSMQKWKNSTWRRLFQRMYLVNMRRCPISLNAGLKTSMYTLRNVGG